MRNFIRLFLKSETSNYRRSPSPRIRFLIAIWRVRGDSFPCRKAGYHSLGVNCDPIIWFLFIFLYIEGSVERTAAKPEAILKFPTFFLFLF